MFLGVKWNEQLKEGQESWVTERGLIKCFPDLGLERAVFDVIFD